MRQRLILTLMVVALVVAACSSSDDDSASDDAATDDTDQSAATEATEAAEEADSEDTDAADSETAEGDAAEPMEPGSRVGLTDTEINLALIYNDTTPFVATGLVPDYGDFEQDFQHFIDKANAEGRFGGRTASLSFHSVQAGAPATEQIPACVEATEDRETFIVMTPGGLAQETYLCVTETHETLLLSIAGSNTDEMFERSDGRFFNNAMGVSRLFEVAISDYAEQGRLDGATIGLVRPDDPEDDVATEALVRELEANGFELAESVTVPCENNSCSNLDNAVEVLRGAGVDALFSFFGATEYPQFVLAAGNAGYLPQYYSSDYENQVFETTARFMQEPSQFYDGAIGTTSAVQQTQVDEFRQDCNDDFTAATGITYEPLTDAWRLVGNACELIDRAARVVENIEADGLEVGQDTFIKYMEQETVRNGDRTGTFGPDKHDAYDVTATLEFDADCQPPDEDGITVCWKELEGTRSTYDG